MLRLDFQVSVELQSWGVGAEQFPYSGILTTPLNSSIQGHSISQDWLYFRIAISDSHPVVYHSLSSWLDSGKISAEVVDLHEIPSGSHWAGSHPGDVLPS